MASEFPTPSAARAQLGPVLVIGATGRTGRLLVAALTAAGAQVRALVRDPLAAAAQLCGKADVVEGDLRDEDALARAMAGVDRVAFVAAGTGGGDRGLPRRIDYLAVRHCAALARAGGVSRMVLLSSAGVTQPEHPHNCTFSSVLKWKARGEDALRSSGVPYVVVRALGLRDRPGGQSGVRLVQGDRIAFGEDIARADVAAFLADVVTGRAERFATPFDARSLDGATLEIYNDRTLPGGNWVSAAERLEHAA